MSELTDEDLERHVARIARARDEEELVTAFADYVKDTVERESDPYDKIAKFMIGLLRGQREARAWQGRVAKGGEA